MRYRSMLTVAAVTAVAATTTVATATTSSAVNPGSATVSQSSQPAGSIALSGPAAAHYKLPSGMREAAHHHVAGRSHPDPLPAGGRGRVGPRWADHRHRAIPAVRPRRSSAPTSRPCGPRTAAKLTKAEARASSSTAPAATGDFDNALRLDPKTGRLFYQVQSIRSDARPVRWIDATTGDAHQRLRRRRRG